MVVVRVFLLENTYVLDGSVFVTKTARNDTYNGLNMAGQLRILYPELDTSRTRHCGRDPTRPKKHVINNTNVEKQLRFLHKYVASHGHSHTHSNCDSDKS